ncbi:REP-associated tyrosine transposase [Planctopirus hydrillae]|uniref:Transposase IS200-like domain-containing protein n=1 Tax=Planctopirus hydrillae TaxID=1841610 RepID=A0A1C3E7E3_9PLAN|nr:transposase [Planctopirus hydrillae]ODA29168.1 hypothetical protein A6X21_09550 [Planctopirus hydrillae]
MKHERRIIDSQLYVHFITFSIDRRRRQLDHDHARRIFLGWLGECLEQYAAKCVGFVLMPDHVHLLIWLPTTGQLSRFVHSLKRRSSLGLREWYRSEADHYASKFGEGERFWQPKYFAFEIHQQAKLKEKLTYIHENPVRAGLVTRAIDWKWSSARWYVMGRTVGVPIEWVE